MSCESSPQLALSWPGPTATIVSIAPTKITLYSGPCFTSFGVAQSYPYQNKYCYIGLAVDVRQKSEPDDRQRRYRKIGPGNGTCSRIGGKHDGFKPSCLGPAKRKNCWTFLARATRNQMVESADPSRSLFTSLVDSHFLISNFHF